MAFLRARFIERVKNPIHGLTVLWTSKDIACSVAELVGNCKHVLALKSRSLNKHMLCSSVPELRGGQA